MLGFISVMGKMRFLWDDFLREKNLGGKTVRFKRSLIKNA